MQQLSISLLAFMFLAAPCGHAATHTFHYDTDLGIATRSADSVCLAIANRKLAAGQVVSLVLLAPEQAIGQAEVVRSLTADCTNAHATQPNAAFYELRIVKGTLPEGAPAIAVINPARAVRLSGGAVVADLDANHQIEYFRECTSSEGVHLTVWTGKPPSGKRRWHDYYYLGYDVEPNCTEAESQESKP